MDKEAYNEVVLLFNDNEDCLGLAYFKNKNADDAIDCLEQAIELQKDSLKYYDVLSFAYALRIKTSGIFTKLNTAGKVRIAWENIIRLDPGNKDIRIKLVKVYLFAPALFGGDEDRGFEIIKELDILQPLASKQLLLEYYIDEDEFEPAKLQFDAIHSDFYKKGILVSKVNPLTIDYKRYVSDEKRNVQ